MAKKDDKKQKFGDIIENHDLVKRTLMVAAYPALIKSVVKEGDELFEGFLPGFEFAQIDDIATEDECVETLQDMLDDEVEELVVFGKSLPYVEEDDVLMKKYPDHKIVYLDINVYATKDELDYYDSCSHDCSCCDHDCGDYDEYDECDCGCEDDCCDDDCDCREHHHEHCDCGSHHEHNHKNCTCKDDKVKAEKTNKKASGKTCKKQGNKSTKK